MKPIISFGKDVSDEWKRNWLKEFYPDALGDFFPEEVEKPSPKGDKKITKEGGKGGN